MNKEISTYHVIQSGNTFCVKKRGSIRATKIFKRHYEAIIYALYIAPFRTNTGENMIVNILHPKNKVVVHKKDGSVDFVIEYIKRATIPNIPDQIVTGVEQFSEMT